MLTEVAVIPGGNGLVGAVDGSMAERNGGGVMRESLREALMEYVTDGGLEPEPDASIKAAACPVNGDFGAIWG